MWLLDRVSKFYQLKFECSIERYFHFCLFVFSCQSFHSFQPRTMSFKKMDPSCTIGFYCETKAEFEKFRQQTTEVSTVNKRYYPKQDTAFFIKNILQHHQSVESLAELSEPMWIPSSVVTFAVIRATALPQFMEQFCSLMKTRLRITANVISGWVPKALLNFQQIVGVEEYFL